MRLEIVPGQECVRDCCSVFLPRPGDTSDTDISQQPPCSPEPLLLFREPISAQTPTRTPTYTHTHTISLSFSVSGPGNKLRVSLSRPRRCQNRTTRTAALSSLCQPRLLMFAAVPPLGTAVHPSALFGDLLSNGTRERLN